MGTFSDLGKAKGWAPLSPAVPMIQGVSTPHHTAPMAIWLWDTFTFYLLSIKEEISFFTFKLNEVSKRDRQEKI